MKKIDIAGLSGFSVSGLLFVISSLRTGDPFSLAGSIVWIFSCFAWIAALLYTRNG